MRFAIPVPQYIDDGRFDPTAFRSYLARAEVLGFESAWAQEQTVGTIPHLGPIEALTYAAACTERLRLGCAVFVSSLHSPLHLAKSIASLDQLSRGRLEVGVGSGAGRGPVLPAAFGVRPDSMLARFTEGVRVMKAVWTEPNADLDGRFWRLDKTAMEPKPFQKPYPPLWFGGGHPNALRRAVAHGDGFFGAGSTTTEAFAEQVHVVREALAGRADFPIAKRVYIRVDDDPERARESVAAGLDRLYGHYGLRDMTPVAVYGTPDDCVRGLREVADAGAELILLNPLSDLPEQMERLAAEVVPHLG